ncbi:MAG: M56 family metallopeptidase [Firmicutes bacterium]|nr:M56 family metallopeptidase [Bacillota bacterium]
MERLAQKGVSCHMNSNLIYNLTELFGSAVLVSLAMTPVILAILILRKVMRGKVKTRYTYILWSWMMAGVLFASVAMAGGFNIAGGVTSYIDKSVENRVQIMNNIEAGVENGIGEITNAGSTAEKNVGGGVDLTTENISGQGVGIQNSSANNQTNGGATMQIARTATLKDKVKQAWESSSPYLAFIWIGGGLVLVMGMMSSFIRLKAKLRFACKMPDEQDVYESSNIQSSFVLGIVKPKIYVPEGIAKDELEMILRHERSHIKAKDNVTIILAYLIMAVFWFNPVFWMYYKMIRRDIELYCDERSTDDMDKARRAEYSRVLLAYAVNPDKLAIAGFSSGESQVKERVENVLNENSKGKKARKIIIITAIVLCVMLVLAGIGVAVWYKGDGYNVNKKEIITASEIVRILENEGIYLEKDSSTDLSQFAVTDIDAAGNEYKLTPKIYIGKAKGDVSYMAGQEERFPAEHEVRVLFYESKHYVGGLQSLYPRMEDAFGLYDPNNMFYANNAKEINGKNIKVVFTTVMEEPIYWDSAAGEEPTDEENEAVFDYWEALTARNKLQSDVFKVLFEKAFNGRTQIYEGESENWKAMIPVKTFNEEVDIDLLGYDTSSYAEGYVLLQPKNENTLDAAIYEFRFENNTMSSTSGMALKESEAYPGWYEVPNANYSSVYDRITAGASRYYVDITSLLGNKENIVLVPEGTEYDWIAGKMEAEAYKATELYKAVKPALTEYVKKQLGDYIDIKNVEINDWEAEANNMAAEFTCHVVYNYYNTDVEKIEYIQFIKEHAKGDYSALYDQYKGYYLAPKVERLNLRVSIKDPGQLDSNVTVIPSTLESGVLALYETSYGGGGAKLFNLTIESFLNPYASLKIVYEPGSKHVLHRSEVSARLDESGELVVYG